MEQLEYAVLEDRWIRSSPSSSRPLCCEWALTHRCNLKCIHCYVTTDSKEKELSFKEIISIIEELRQEGCLWLTFSGGEPLMRQDFWHIYTCAREKGFFINIFTNGTLFNQENIKLLEQYSPFMVEITLHSLKKDVFERISCVKGSFQRCLDGIHMLVKAKIPLTLKTVGMSLNKEEILKIKDFAKSLGGVRFKFDAFINPRQDGSRQPQRFRLSPDEILEIEFKDKEIKGHWRQCQRHSQDFMDKRMLFTCDAGLNSFYLDPYGKLQLCAELVQASFDLREGSFKEGFYNFLSNLRSGEFKIGSKCRQCKIYHLCGQCPARAVSEHGDAHEPVEFFCQLAHKTAKHIDQLGKED